MSPRGSVPDGVAREVARALGSPEDPDPVESASALGGGCIHPAARIRTGSGTEAFLKWNPDPGPGGFGVEARGLEALARREGLRVPRVLAFREGGPDSRGWLLLELIREGPGKAETGQLLGTGLARLHRPIPDGTPGWAEHGILATLPQPNLPGLSWPDFWVQARLLPRWKQVHRAFGREAREVWERAAANMDRILDGWEEDGVSLLHGDLWSGNVLTDQEGRPVLIDPAVYRGHREVDLAMMELFGGFSGGARDTAREAWPLPPGYENRRRHAYQLYPLLVHVELFGGSYVAGASARIRKLASC